MKTHRVLYALVMGPLLVASLLTFSACNDRQVHAKVCVDTDTGLRAHDDQCDRASTSQRYRWKYFGGGIRIPAVGKKPPNGGSFNEPEGDLARIPEEGGFANNV